MKALVIGFVAPELTGWEVSHADNIQSTSPFGFDVVIIKPHSLHGLIPGREYGYYVTRWQEELSRWLEANNKLIVVIEPYAHVPGTGFHNYSWLPMGMSANNFINAGSNSHIGNIVASDHYMNNFLSKPFFSAGAYYKSGDDSQSTVPYAELASDMLTSFGLDFKGKEKVVFIPRMLNYDNLAELLLHHQASTSTWKVTQATQAQTHLDKINDEMIALNARKQNFENELHNIDSKVSALVQNNIYLKRSIEAFSRASSSENPEPDDFYEAIESMERAFGSERKMRETLNVPKTYVSKVMQRTNEFRHVSKTGETPQSLSNEERTDFLERTEAMIKKYLQYLYDSEGVTSV